MAKRRLRERKIEDVIRYVEARAGEVLDRYVGPSISMFRARLTGELIRTLLTIEEVATDRSAAGTGCNNRGGAGNGPADGPSAERRHR